VGMECQLSTGSVVHIFFTAEDAKVRKVKIKRIKDALAMSKVHSHSISAEPTKYILFLGVPLRPLRFNLFR